MSREGISSELCRGFRLPLIDWHWRSCGLCEELGLAAAFHTYKPKGCFVHGLPDC